MNSGADGAPLPADVANRPLATSEPPVDSPAPENAAADRDSIAERRAAARQGGGQERIDAQHARGKLTARERIKRMLDAESFEEIAPYVEHRHAGFGLEKSRHAGDGVVTGFGLIDGRRVAIFAQDFTVLGGSFSEVQAMKVGRLLEAATSSGLPIIALLDSVGARIQEGVWSLAGFGDLFWRNTQASGVVPQISLMLGPCAGGAVYSPGLTDFVVMTRGNSFMFITGPDVIQTVTGEEVDAETLGGATTHAAGSGVAHFVADDENGAFALTRRLLGYLPSNNVDDPPALPPDDALAPDAAALDGLIPESAELSYDIRDAIALIADRDSFLEVQADFAPNAVVGFARLSGRVAAVVANQPAHLAGVLDIDASDKIAPVHPVLGRVQHPDRDLGGLPRLPSRQRAGAQGHHPSRRQDRVRLLGGDRTQGLGGAPEGLRRRLHRDEQQDDPHGRVSRVADGRDRGHGSEGRRQHPVRPAARGGRSRANARPSGAGSRMRSRRTSTHLSWPRRRGTSTT